MRLFEKKFVLQTVLACLCVFRVSHGLGKEESFRFPPQTAEERADYLVRAEGGDVWYQFLLGELYDPRCNTTSLFQDQEEAFKAYPRDAVKAAQWYGKAAAQGAVDAQMRLASMYREGLGVPKDAKKAVEWYRKAGQRETALVNGTEMAHRATSSPKAQLQLGIMYSAGEGVPKDEVKAVGWFHGAAESGLSEAQSYVGMAYWKGRGSKKDAVKAVGWFRKAAQQGELTAQLCLGIMYANGEGVPKDLVESYAWLNLAAVHLSEAATHRGTLEKSMPSTQVADGQARSRELAKQIEARQAGE